MYFAGFHGHLRYGLTLWGNDPEIVRIFRLQKKVIRIIGKVGRYAAYRNLFKKPSTLPVPCLYISDVVCYIISNMEKMKCNEVHDHCTHTHTKDLHVQFCRTTLCKNTSANVGIKLYNKLPNMVKKLEKIRDF
jgi:hypothetical protein